MIRSVVLGLFIPLANAIAQSAPVQLTITSTNQFRIVRSTRDSVLPPKPTATPKAGTTGATGATGTTGATGSVSPNPSAS